MSMRFASAGIILIQPLTAFTQATANEQPFDRVLESCSDKAANALPLDVEKVLPVSIKPLIAQGKPVDKIVLEKYIFGVSMLPKLVISQSLSLHLAGIEILDAAQSVQ